MSKAKRRVRCPYCHGLHTKRYGSFSVNQGSKSHKRYYCYDCQRTFTLWSHQLTEEAVKLYFDTQASYRAIGRALQVWPITAYRKIIHIEYKADSQCQQTFPKFFMGSRYYECFHSSMSRNSFKIIGLPSSLRELTLYSYHPFIP